MNRMKYLEKFMVGVLLSLFPLVLPAQQAPPASEYIAQATLATEPAAQNQSQAVLDELVREALERNPAVQAAASRVEALRHRVPQAQSLPDPKVSAAWNGNLKPFGVLRRFPPSSRGAGISQTIPYPGKLRLRGEIAGREADAARWDYEAVRRRVAAQVKVGYYNYFYFAQALGITRAHQDLLAKLAEIAGVRYRVGKGLQQDVFKAQTELSKILQRLTVLEQQHRTAQVRLNTLLNRDPEAPLPPATTYEPAEFTYALATLYQLARENDTGLAREDRLIERNQLAVNLAQKAYYPDFTLSYKFQNRPLLPDTHSFTIGINIPVFYRSKQREGVLEATQSLLTARRSREARETLVNFEVKQHYLAAKASEELARLYAQAITPQSALALESSMTAYAVGRVEFLTVLDNYRTVLDAELRYHRETADFQIALARLESLVGIELTK